MTFPASLTLKDLCGQRPYDLQENAGHIRRDEMEPLEGIEPPTD